MGDKPTAAFALSLVAAIFIILGGILTLAWASIFSGVSFLLGADLLGTGFLITGVMGLVWGILVLVGAVMMNSENTGKIRTGAILVLIFSIISWVGAWGGFFIGFLLGLIGAILGLTWHPSQTQRNVPPPPP